MKKKTSLKIGISLLVIAIVFIFYALNHPEAAFPWGSRMTFLLYGAYIWMLFRFLLVPLFEQKRQEPYKAGLPSALVYLFITVVFLLIEVRTDETDIYTAVRGFIMIGGMDIGLGNLYRLLNAKHQ